MLQLDSTLLAPKIAQAMAYAGWGLPPLNWATRANQTAQSMLDDADDANLFAPHQVSDETMASAVRALLYLWSGWPVYCHMWTASVPEIEKQYLAAMAERHNGNFEESKTHLQQLPDRPIDDALAKLAIQLIGDHTETPLKKFRDLVKLGKAWEPFAFTDLIMQADNDSFSHASEEIIQKLQWQEFNLLMHRCYLAATGVDITKQEQTQAPAKPTRRSERPSPARVQRNKPLQPKSHAKPSGDKPSQAATGKNAAPSNIRIKCPKCKYVSKFPESARGQTVKCGGCATAIRIAGGDKQPQSSDKVRLACPKCGAVAAHPESNRNKKVSCHKCRATFLFAA